MIRFQLTIRGNDEIVAQLRAAASKSPRQMDDALYRWAQGVRGKLKSTPYPPKRANQRYVRTGRLASSWRAERQGQGKVLIANSATYSGYVVGGGPRNRQAWMHVGRWWKGYDVIAENRPELRAAVIKELDKMLK